MDPVEVCKNQMMVMAQIIKSLTDEHENFGEVLSNQEEKLFLIDHTNRIMRQVTKDLNRDQSQLMNFSQWFDDKSWTKLSDIEGFGNEKNLEEYKINLVNAIRLKF